MTTMRSVSRALAIGAAAATLAGSAVAPPARAQTSPELKTEEQKTLYALGAASAMNLRSLELEPAEAELMIAGLRDVLLGKTPKIDPQGQMTQIQAFVRGRNERAIAKERDASKAFLEKAAKQPGAKSRARAQRQTLAQCVFGGVEIAAPCVRQSQEPVRPMEMRIE